MAKVIDILFGCAHNKTTFPITLKASPQSKLSESRNTYIVCLDCGKEFPYDWQQMKLKASSPPPAKVRAA